MACETFVREFQSDYLGLNHEQPLDFLRSQVKFNFVSYSNVRLSIWLYVFSPCYCDKLQMIILIREFTGANAKGKYAKQSTIFILNDKCQDFLSLSLF